MNEKPFDETTPAWSTRLYFDSTLPNDGIDWVPTSAMLTAPPRRQRDWLGIALDVVIVAGVTAYVVGTIVAQAMR